jgi:hypothetical protein
MELRDNKNEQPLRHYRALLASLDPAAVAGRTGIPYGDGCFMTRLLDREVRIAYPEGDAVWTESGSPLRPGASILLLRLLTGGTLAPPTGKLLSYAEMPWGETYLTQFRGRCINRLAFSFGNDPEKFAAACRSVGGRRADTGSGVSFDIPFLPELTIRLTVWPAEEDFPPSAQFLFSSNFSLAFSAEDLAYCGDTLLDAMKGRF